MGEAWQHGYVSTLLTSTHLYALMLPGKGRDLVEENGQGKERSGVGRADNVLIVQDGELGFEVVEGSILITEGEERTTVPKRKMKVHQQKMGGNGRTTLRAKLLSLKHTGQT